MAACWLWGWGVGELMVYETIHPSPTCDKRKHIPRQANTDLTRLGDDSSEGP